MADKDTIIDALNFTIQKSAYNYESGVVVDGQKLNVTHGYCEIPAGQMESETSIVTHDPQGNPVKDYAHSFLDVTKVYLEVPRPNPNGSGMIKGWTAFESPGIAASQIWLLFWLYATVEVEQVEENQFNVTIDPKVLPSQAPSDSAEELSSALNHSVVAQQEGPFQGEVTLGDDGVIQSFFLMMDDFTREQEAGVPDPETGQKPMLKEQGNRVVHTLQLIPTMLRQLEFPSVGE